MKTWNEIISQPGTPRERLDDLLALWDDIMRLYTEVPMMYFDTHEYKAHMEQKYVRSVYPSVSSSFIRVPSADTATMQTNQILEFLKEDDNNFRLLNGWARIFNESLDLTERAIIVRKYFYHEHQSKICKICSVSKRTFFRILNKARSRLIKEYALDLYE